MGRRLRPLVALGLAGLLVATAGGVVRIGGVDAA